MNHLGDPCIHCGGAHDNIKLGACPHSFGEAASAREVEYLSGRLRDYKKTVKTETEHLEAAISAARTKLQQQISGLDIRKTEIAKTVLYAGKYANGGDERASVIVDAIKWFATGQAGYLGLKHEYFGTKSYDRWHGQRCDCEYGHGPRHGNIIFSVGLQKDVRSRELTDEEKDAAIYFLMNIEKIQEAEK